MGSYICRKPRRGDSISAGNLDGGGGGGDSISAGNLYAGPHICRKPISGIPYLQEAWMWGDPVPTGSQMRNPISAGNLDGGDPISAGNLDGGGGGGSRTYSKPDVGSHSCRKPDGESHICRKPGWGGIPYLQEAR